MVGQYPNNKFIKIKRLPNTLSLSITYCATDQTFSDTEKNIERVRSTQGIK